jgi:5-methylcytosine-specific restriction endonuclease McrA
MILRACTICGAPTTHTRTARCDRHPKQRSRHPATDRTREWRTVRSAVLMRYDNVCAYCGAPATEVDHVVPVARGGSALDPANLVASCLPCNRRKGGR